MANFDIDIEIKAIDSIVIDVSNGETVDIGLITYPPVIDSLRAKVADLERQIAEAVVEIATDHTVQGDGKPDSPLSIAETVASLLAIIRQLAPELLISGVAVDWDSETQSISVITTTQGGISPIQKVWQLTGTTLTVTVTDAVGQEDENIIDLANEYPIIINSVDVEWDNGFEITPNATGGFGSYGTSFTQDGAILNITVTDQIGIEATTTADLDTISPIAISSLTFETTGENEAVITCVASGGFGNLLYSLYFGDTFIDQNETGIFTVTLEGTYSVVVSDEGGATPDSDLIEIAFGLPFQDDLVFKAISRSGMDLLDASNVKQADILTPSFLYSTGTISGDKTRQVERLFDGNSHTIYFRLRQLVAAGVGTGHNIVRLGRNSGTVRGALVQIASQRVRFYISDGTTIYSPYVTAVGTNVNDYMMNKDFHVLMQIDYPNRLFWFKLYDENLNLHSEISQDISAFTFNNNENNSAWDFINGLHTVKRFKKYSGVKTIADCVSDTYVTDLQVHLPIVLYGIDVSGNNLHFTPSTSITTTSIVYEKDPYLLDYGYSIYRKSDALDNIKYKIAPNNYLKETVTMNQSLLGWRITEERGFDAVHNIAESKLRFVNAFFDRSDATIWNANARGATYDAANPRDFFMSDLKQNTLQSWLNDGYRGRLFVHMAPASSYPTKGNDALIKTEDRLVGIYLYNTDRKGSDALKILNFTGDKVRIATDNDLNYLNDAQGYPAFGTLKTTIPMLVVRLDDGYPDARTAWKPFFDTFGIRVSMNIHTAIMGTTEGLFTFMSWAQCKELYDAGWEICSGGMYDNDWDTTAIADVRNEVLTSKAQIEAQGIECNVLVPNRRGMENLAVRFFGHKYGYLSCYAGSYLAPREGANFQAIDPFYLAAMPADLDLGVFNLNKADNSAEVAAIKAELDYAVANNSLAIIYLHGWNENKQAGMQQVLQYAATLGIENVTIKEALANSRYML